jgi:hypothetical protein
VKCSRATVVDRAALDRLVADGALVSAGRDPEWVQRVIEDATRDLRWARRKLEPGELEHPAGAAADGWEAALKAIQGFLNLARLRLGDRPGHHVAALNALAALLDDDDHKALVRSLRELRRARRSGVYDVGPPPDVESLNAGLNAVEDLLAELKGAVDRYLST